ncbi:MAG: undecaprenyldiphospho-muramoylpentapeptide beta-N-acetylglucosaminyltransferase [Bacteroidales bacterium]|nr:undecaprenyldiphospho-muramoylpentapeptide beta-N-acetylglucosaminyltransferase [Bacteroidales bacterium]MCI7614025.1 undecaprenyldiphospho-muramoylpentapeptide beta-N-acetylglucosaminyltransferase [Bacteroidales bacterium]
MNIRVIISGGGTGGHIFPAVSIANAIREKQPDAEILFVGAEGRMEMQRVPAAGYEIKGLPVAGFDRKHLWRNVSVVIKLLRSRIMARRIIKAFRPMVAVGVGGYASGPTLDVAGKMGIPTLLQEQNSYAGVTNKLLAKNARRICVAYDGMERFFPADRILFTGNPVRQNLLHITLSRQEAAQQMGLDPAKRTVLIVGGSLGARSMNESVLQQLELIRQQTDVQFVWQTGKYYSEAIAQQLKERTCPPNLHVMDFISDMAVAYAAADLVVSRAGAGSISEFCLLGKPVILVPSPNVAEDHQTKNAMALVQKDAALYVPDAEAPDNLLPTAISTVKNTKKLQALSQNILRLARPNAASDIADEVIRLAEAGR